MNQTWNASHRQWNGGAMDGFVTTTNSTDPMGYLDGTDLPWYYGFARAYGIGDRYFASVLAQTFPNRRFLQAATAAGLVSTSIPSPFATPPATGLIWDQLDAHGIGWANYFVELPEVGLWPRNLLKYHATCTTSATSTTTAREGRLPPVTVVTTEALARLRGRVPGRPGRGGAHRQPVRSGGGAARSGSNMLFVINWDEGGGFYDHVPPPAAVTPDDIPPDIHVPPD